ncbi:phage portal protein [Adlercreutzia sp. ZJ141]|uniref:phage portal protein n=1 Tax=Adlercreutzia sp. ZJ141 TaxID=2709406 RepID=UPI0013EBA5D3|nr:phage portal protein [Adlercreutzia sp. ZJ141]
MNDINLNLATGVSNASGLLPEDRDLVKELVDVWRKKRRRNLLREDYYLCHVRVKDLGISMPDSLAKKIDPRVDWPRKAVHALADRSVLDGFTASDEVVQAELMEICAANGLNELYRKNLIGALKHCCGFWTVTSGDDARPVISAYPATAASAVWDDSSKTIRAGLVMVESKARGGERVPMAIDVYTADAIISLRFRGGAWRAEYLEHSMGRPLMEHMPYGPTLERPFGTSRITRSVMSITDDAIRQRARMEVAAESSTLPQIWLLGTYKRVTDGGNKFDASMGAVNEITKDADGDRPTVWQSAQLQMAPLTEYLRQLACQMSAVTNVPVSFFGVSNDNPSSSDAIAASLEPLVIDARNMNRDNGSALRNVAYMALAVLHGTDFATERDAGYNVTANFLPAAYPSVVSQSDALLKQVQSIPKIANSDVSLEMLGYTADQIKRINSDSRRAQGRAVVEQLIAGGTEDSNAAVQEGA